MKNIIQKSLIALLASNSAFALEAKITDINSSDHRNISVEIATTGVATDSLQIMNDGVNDNLRVHSYINKFDGTYKFLLSHKCKEKKIYHEVVNFMVADGPTIKHLSKSFDVCKPKQPVLNNTFKTANPYANNAFIEKELTAPIPTEGRKYLGYLVNINGETEKSFDYVTVYTADNDLNEKLSGVLNHTYPTDSNKVKVRFESDSSVVKEGVTVEIVPNYMD